MAKTYAYAIAGGLIATFTVTPALCALLLPEHVEETETFARSRRCTRLRAGPRASRSAQPSRSARRASAVVLPVVGVRSLGLEFLPKLEEGNLWIRATMPSTISLEEGNAYVNGMRRLVKSFPEVDTVVSQHGRPDDGTDAAGLLQRRVFRAAEAGRAMAPRASTRTRSSTRC